MKKEDVSEKEFQELLNRIETAEGLLTELAKGFWIATLNDADYPVKEKLGDRVRDYWQRFIN